MKSLLEKMFELHGFIQKTNIFIESSPWETVVFTREQSSETFVVVFPDVLNEELYDKINLFTDNGVYQNTILSKEERSNLSLLIVVCDVRKPEIDRNMANTIFKIEEDTFYYKKYILWYSNVELAQLYPLLEPFEMISKQRVSDILHSSDSFDLFRAGTMDSYALLSRLFIKLPFMGLLGTGSTGVTMRQTLKDELDLLSGELYNLIVESDNIDIERCIQLIGGETK